MQQMLLALRAKIVKTPITNRGMHSMPMHERAQLVFMNCGMHSNAQCDPVASLRRGRELLDRFEGDRRALEGADEAASGIYSGIMLARG